MLDKAVAVAPLLLKGQLNCRQCSGKGGGMCQPDVKPNVKPFRSNVKWFPWLDVKSLSYSLALGLPNTKPKHRPNKGCRSRLLVIVMKRREKGHKRKKMVLHNRAKDLFT